KIAWRKVILFVVVGIVRDVHLAIPAHELSLRVVDQRRVVELAIVTSFVNRPSDHKHAIRGGTLGKKPGKPSWHGLGEFEKPIVLGLSKITVSKQLLETDDVRTFSRCGLDEGRGLIEI